MAGGGKKGQADWESLELHFKGYLRGGAKDTDALFRELTRVLKAYYRVRLPSEAEADDLLQASLLKIHFARDRYDSNRALKTWVFTIASRTLIDHWRGASEEAEHLDSGAPSMEEGEEVNLIELLPALELSPALQVELKNDLNDALKTLKPIERSVVYLYGVEEMSMKEIGEALGITEAAAKLRAHRAYKELRKVLGALLVLLFPRFFL